MAGTISIGFEGNGSKFSDLGNDVGDQVGKGGFREGDGSTLSKGL